MPQRPGLILVAPFVLVAAGIAASAVACSSATTRSGFDTASEEDGGGIDAGLGFTDGAVPCQGLECKRLPCEGKEKTSLTGKVYDPAGAVPLYNVMVYIPGGPKGDAELPPISNSLEDGVTCDRCGGVALSPMVSALTNTAGEFVLEDVPVDVDVPVVVQVGKWRRKMKFDITKSCEENTVPDREFRLPKNGSEGDMPHIAVTSGGYDALQCLLRGMGVDESEFVAGDDPKGHVHVFNGAGGNAIPSAPSAQSLWTNPAMLKRFDIALLSCEAGEHNDNKGDRSAIHEYTNAGGRVFATHYQYTWFKNSPVDEFQQIADWTTSSSSNPFSIDTSFPKGEAFADWLLNVNASPTLGEIHLTDTSTSLSSVRAPAQSWIMGRENGGPSTNKVKYFSFNTPLAADEEDQCGRAVFSDVHLMGPSAAKQVFPNGCPAAGGLSAQQKAVEFLFFDLSACVQSDNTPPTPPN
jgi:hypothetical protein